MKTCCFTGHRNLTSENYRAINADLSETIRRLNAAGVTRFISGGASGFDTYAAAMVGSLRAEIGELELVLALPFRAHYVRWGEADRSRFDRIRKIADREVVLAEKYSPNTYWMRNMWMVEQADVCVACWSGAGGGTAQTVAAAHKKGIEVINLWR